MKLKVQAASSPARIRDFERSRLQSESSQNADGNPTMADILIIDDDEEIRAWLRVTLEEAGYVVREAADGNAALRMYDERAPDLLILDLVMPNKDGMETAIEIRRRNINAKIIAMSGSPYNLKVARMLGANDIISKPFSEPALLTLVKATLGTP